MTLKEQIMKLQTYKMFEGEDTVYVEREDVLKLLEQQTCEDAISKHAVLETIDSRIEQIKKDADEINKSYSHLSYAEGVYNGYCRLKCDLWDLPSVTPKFTDEEILKMQELEQAQLEKVYELGKAEMQPCEDCISRTEALKHSHIEYDDDGEGHRVVYVEDLEELPTVTPQPKMGRWIFDEILDKHYYCSECKSMGVNYWDYCPNCGAKMAEEERENDE